MKVILLQDMDKFGKEGTVVKVANGYGRNYLIPKGFALEASKGNLTNYSNRKREWNLKNQKEIAEAEQFAEDVAKITLKIERKVGEKEKLFGSVTSMDIVEALEKENIEIDKKRIVLDEPIKSLGNYTVPIKVHPEVVVHLKIEVVKGQDP